MYRTDLKNLKVDLRSLDMVIEGEYHDTFFRYLYKLKNNDWKNILMINDHDNFRMVFTTDKDQDDHIVFIPDDPLEDKATVRKWELKASIWEPVLRWCWRVAVTADMFVREYKR